MIPTQKPDQSLPLPPAERVEAPAPTVTEETPKQGPGALDKYNAVAGAIGSAVQNGLSYANARRARSTYRG